ncbi:MAG: toll/interleukin-1 receptor domain-containing protein [Anaerolineaceae bacterium]|nr:toll/interleukin-1 receptor domain-containing protein [Anaerolineaceae bacterium]
MNTELHSILTEGNKEIPKGTTIQLRVGRLPSTVRIEIQLPGQKTPTDLGDLPIADGIVRLPLKLLFFSYAREDRDKVQELADRLWQQGFLTWLDTKDLLPGDTWKSKIEDAIERADYVLVFLSKTSVNKVGYVQRELRYALERQQLRPAGTRYIIPIRLNSCELPRELHKIQWLDLWEESAYKKLKTALQD